LDEVEKVIPTKDGGVLMGIYSRSGIYNGQSKTNINNGDASTPLSMTEPQIPTNLYSKITENNGEGDYWIVKLDKNNQVQWEKNFGGSEDDHIRTLALTDSGYIIGGESRSETSGNKRAKLEEGTDLWVLALDDDGNEQWQQSYNFGNRDVLMSLNEIKGQREKNQDGTKGFLIGGYTQSEGKVEKNDETFWMLYIDRNGKEVWRKYVEGKDKKKEERLTSAILNRDGSYILAGTSAEELGRENWKVVKLLDGDVEDLMENKDIRIYPNPVKDYCYVELSSEFFVSGSGQADIYVYDMTGKVIQKLQTKNKVTKVDTSKIPQGVYIIKANIPAQQDKNLTIKIVKE
ncbi:MAG: T9SS type A sorting domain-containing protein, partial [Chryseobacterium sp.]|nr:T9SS type A sorting domain-containing protein [Chryseobacterium sp.]